jgi:hypothetical protein
MSLTVNDNVVLTDLAYERAKKLGVSIVSPRAYTPPAAPVRPYISKEQKQSQIELKPAAAPTFFSHSSEAGNSIPAPAQKPGDARTVGITPLAHLDSEKNGAADGYPRPHSTGRADAAEIRKRVREEVMQKYGSTEPALLDTIINRVLAGMGIE